MRMDGFVDVLTYTRAELLLAEMSYLITYYLHAK